MRYSCIARLAVFAVFACGVPTTLCAQRSVSFEIPIAPEPPLARAALRTEALGCWALFDAKGDRANKSLYWDRRDSTRYEVRARGRRTATRLDDLGQNLDERNASSRYFASATWWADSLSDTIRVSFSSGFSGSSFAFSLRAPPRTAADTMRGRASESFDYGPTYPERGAAMAVRVRCP